MMSLNSCFLLKEFTKHIDLSRNICEKTFSTEEIEALKGTTTLFFLKRNDSHLRDEFEKAIKSAWTFTDIEVIEYFDLPKYTAGNYSYFLMEGFASVSYDKYGNRLVSLDIFLSLEAMVLDENGDFESVNFCRIELYPDLFTNVRVFSKSTTKGFIEDLYEYSNLKNWTPAMLGLYLKEVQNQLQNSRREWLYETTSDKAALKGLKYDTLYVPHYFVSDHNGWVGTKEEIKKKKKLFKKYPFAYEIVDSDVLSEKILSGEARYVLDYVRDKTEHFIRVYDTEIGCIYKRHKRSLIFKLGSKDIKRIIEGV